MKSMFIWKSALCVPVLMSLAASWWPSESPIVERAVRGALAFDQYTVNLRHEPIRPYMSGDYRFTNVGDQPLTITEFEPSCGCLQPRLAGDKKTYQPGERGMFRVQIATANESPGSHAYSIKVKYTDPQPRGLAVHFNVTLPERKVSVDPAELAFFQYNGEPSSRTIYVTDYRGSSLDVLQASSRSEFISIDVLPAETDEAGHHRVPIKLSVPGTVPAGRQILTVTIETNDPEYAAIRIPVLIDGPRTKPGAVQVIGHEVPVAE